MLLIHREVVAAIQKHADPEAVDERVYGQLVRREYYAQGPDHVWASDGHDKLKPHGIAIYGFIDCWSRKLLGLYAHVTNSDPRHVGLWFLDVAEKAGGVPQKLTTDRGTETIDLATLQTALGELYGNLHKQPLEQLHRYVPSYKNIKIESFWRELGIGLTYHLKEGIERAIKGGLKPGAVKNAQGGYNLEDYDEPIYDEDDELQRYGHLLSSCEHHLTHSSVAAYQTSISSNLHSHGSK